MTRKTASKRKWLPLGTISEGTLKSSDLIAALLDALAPLKLSKYERTELREIASHDYSADDDDAIDAAILDYEVLESIADAHTPEHTYYGSADGDGALIGVWVDWDRLNEDVELGNVTRIGPKDTRELGEVRSVYVLGVNDYGNATMLKRERNGHWIIVWSLV